MTRFSVVVPAYNRPDELRRALQSVAIQSQTDFECIVVDDCSPEPLQVVVSDFDERFSYVRRQANGGATAARMTGLGRANGALVMSLDSDNELFPWTLERGAQVLQDHPDADSAIGLYVFPDGLRLRVAEAPKVVGPDEFIARSSPAALGDSVGIVRRQVVEEWLRIGSSYYTTELVFSLQLHLHHAVVLVDEPWGRFHTDSRTRVSNDFHDPRRLADIERFVAEFRPRLGTSPCGPLDTTLKGMWMHLFRAGRYKEARVVADWMHERGIPRRAALRQNLTWAIRRRLGPPHRVPLL